MELNGKKFKLPDMGGKKLKITQQNRFAILKAVSDFHGIPVSEIVSKTQKHDIVRLRAQAIYFYRKYTSLSLQKIADIVGGKDHCTMLNALKRIDEYIETDYSTTRLELIGIFNSIHNLIVNQDKKMMVVYIAHQVAGDVAGNINEILHIVRGINLANPHIVPFVPYLADIQAMDDAQEIHRKKGIVNDTELINRDFIDACWLYGPRISEGMRNEIELFRMKGVPVVSMSAGTRLDLHMMDSVDKSRKMSNVKTEAV